ncbi:hypothetical protein [Streptomyces sp. NPDC005336]|uniref:hypothetical protein n=1 Tax=Streptomyces sp. NPDC005336 TaxID=3157035 RepID=UPI0033AEFB2F
MPFALVAAVVVALVITLTLVMPSLWLAGRAGARFGGQGAWWWPPAMGVAVSAGPVAVVGSAAWLLDGGAAPPAAYLWWWLAIAALVVPAGLPARLSRRRATAGRPIRRPVRTVLFHGCAGMAATLALALLATGVATLAG